jgi:hypothetical protein
LTEVNKTFNALEGAIDAHVKNTSPDGTFVTGWHIICSLSSPDHDIGSSDGYVTYTSDGLPYHAQVGLLKMALDDKANISFMAMVTAFMVQQEDEEEDE